jgi:hypothetical protein
MTQELLSLVLPVLWALIGTLIGLLLYRSSSAFFSSTQKTQKGTRAIRLTGSIAIAAIAFYGMKAATPPERLLGARQGTVLVPEYKVNELAEFITQLDRTALEVQACVATIVDETCKEKTQSLKNEASTMQAKIADLKQ